MGERGLSLAVVAGMVGRPGFPLGQPRRRVFCPPSCLIRHSVETGFQRFPMLTAHSSAQRDSEKVNVPRPHKVSGSPFKNLNLKASSTLLQAQMFPWLATHLLKNDYYNKKIAEIEYKPR